MGQHGGIVGGIATATVQNCYNSGNITGRNVGGICGESFTDTKIKNSYNSGNLTGSTRVSAINALGNQLLKAENNYYLENTVNGTNVITGSGTTIKTSEELKKAYLLLGEMFKEDTNNINNGYPILSWQ